MNWLSELIRRRSGRRGWTLAGLMLLAVALGAARQDSLPRAESSRSVDTFEGSYSARRHQLSELDPERLDELRRRKNAFEQLSEADRKRVQQLHEELQTHPDSEQLQLVMRRYYRWLKTLDDRERRELLDLPPLERLEKIRGIRDRQARASFGRVGATKLPDEDVGWVYEWIKQTVTEKREAIDSLFQLPEIQQRLSTTTRRSFSQPSLNLRRSNFRFLWLANNAPEYAGKIVIEEFDKLRAGLSTAALEIIDEYGPEEQMDLVIQWYKAAYYARTNVTDDKLFEFWQGLPPEEKEQMDQLSHSEWRRRLESRYFHSLYTAQGGLDEQGEVDWPGRSGPRRRFPR